MSRIERQTTEVFYKIQSWTRLTLFPPPRLLIILDPSATTKLCQVTLPAVPTMMRVSGCFDVDWRIIVACRDARLYTVSIGEHRGTAVIRRPHIELETQVCGLVRQHIGSY